VKAHAIATEDVGPDQIGWILTADLRSKQGKRLFRKGAIIDEQMLDQWDDAEPQTLHLIEPESGDLHEDEAGRRMAAAVTGDGLRIKGPIQSRYHLIAERRGLLRVDVDLLREINRLEGLTVYTLLDRQTVLQGKVVAGVKTTPIIVPAEQVERLEQIVADADRPPITVLPFKPKRVAILATEGLSDKLRDRFHQAVEKKIRWYGSELADLRFIPSESADVARTFEAFLESGADILMAAGGNTIDPLDPILQGLHAIGAEMIHFGAPAHPGSMFWVAQKGNVPIFNLASCSMYAGATVADLILPLAMTGQQITSDDVVEIGYGGVLEREMAFRFPDYDADASDEGENVDE
jgi:hypothetical protein